MGDTTENKQEENNLPPEIDPKFFLAEDYMSDLNKAEVKGSAVMTAVNAFPNHNNIMVEMLKSKGIDFLFPDNWYQMSNWVECLNEIKDRFSNIILLEMGKYVIESADFPPHIRTLNDALNSLNIAFHMNHRFGRIGYYKLEEFNEDRKFAIMKCHHPYPSIYDKGIFQGMGNKFRPATSFMIHVSLMKMDEPSKDEGGTTDYFKIKW